MEEPLSLRLKVIMVTIVEVVLSAYLIHHKTVTFNSECNMRFEKQNPLNFVVIETLVDDSIVVSKVRDKANKIVFKSFVSGKSWFSGQDNKKLQGY